MSVQPTSIPGMQNIPRSLISHIICRTLQGATSLISDRLWTMRQTQMPSMLGIPNHQAHLVCLLLQGTPVYVDPILQVLEQEQNNSLLCDFSLHLLFFVKIKYSEI